jgi:hypothetical protein
MNVIAFPQRRQEFLSTAERRRSWSHDELQQLLALSASLASRSDTVGGGATWDVGTTEDGDPQFYQLGTTLEAPCAFCISRIGCLYVLEDGNGGVIAEGGQLRPLIEKASRALARRNASAFITRSLLALYTFRLTVEQKLEPFLAESAENWNRIAPELVALI